MWSFRARCLPIVLTPFLASIFPPGLCSSSIGLSGDYIATNDDLYNFVTRPDIRSARFNVTIFDHKSVTPGYLFVAPYDCTLCHFETSAYIGQQIGPHIYDHNGELIWSGTTTLIASNRRAYDFKVAAVEGRDHLTYIASRSSGTVFEDGAMFILDNAYQQMRKVLLQNATQDMHEFNVINDGRSALTILFKDRSRADRPDLRDFGFREMELGKGDVSFEWWASEHIAENESTASDDMPNDPVHLNSVEKTSEGDYLVSARHTDAIYLISSRDGRVIWRLGGKLSDFILDGFNFSRQHDARILKQNHTTMEISFLDNASYGGSSNATASASALLIVALRFNASPMIATLIKRIERPDGKYSFARGSMQVLNNGNILGGWGDEAYITEHTADGELVFEAAWVSDRFVNYRAYKFNFTAHPTDWPAMKAFASVNSEGRLTTLVYASWDGATEVHSWDAYSVVNEYDAGVLIGSAKKTGFETSFACLGYHEMVVVKAIDIDGKVLSESAIDITEIPVGWHERWTSNGPIEDAVRWRKVVFSFFSGMVAMFCLLRIQRRRISSFLNT